MEALHQFVETFLKEYVWYHAITLTVIAIISCLITVHRKGTDQNYALATQHKELLEPLLTKSC